VRQNTIRALADAIRMSADSLIVFANAIRKFTLVRIAQKLWGMKKLHQKSFGGAIYRLVSFSL